MESQKAYRIGQQKDVNKRARRKRKLKNKKTWKKESYLGFLETKPV
jgi:hypothetical protein